MTLNELEQRNSSIFRYFPEFDSFWRSITSQWLKIVL